MSRSLSHVLVVPIVLMTLVLGCAVPSMAADPGGVNFTWQDSPTAGFGQLLRRCLERVGRTGDDGDVDALGGQFAGDCVADAAAAACDDRGLTR